MSDKPAVSEAPPPAAAVPSAGSPTSPPPRQYVGLLTEIMTNTLDEDYATVAAKRSRADVGVGASRDGTERAGTVPGHGRHVALLAVLAAFGLMIGVSFVKTDQERPQAQAERDELVTQIHNAQDDQDSVTRQISAVQDQVTRLQGSVGDEVSRNSAITSRLETLGLSAGTIGAQGPGMVITTDDASPARAGSGGTILDSDLQALANALWEAGAEAISINDHRLTSLTAIRLAGTAITVDNVSLSPPYVVNAIGNPDTLPARLLETDGGQTWLGLEANFGIRFDRQTKENVSVPGDMHEHLLYAAPLEDR